MYGLIFVDCLIRYTRHNAVVLKTLEKPLIAKLVRLKVIR